MADLTPIIRIGATSLQRLAETFAIQGLKPIQGSGKNPYDGKMGPVPVIDQPIATSILGTPVFCDLTLGDPVNQAANSFTDNNGVRRTFKAMNFQTILMTIDQTKNIEKTKIQGLDGEIKEYIGMGDYQVTINGIIPGGNGIYPRDDVNTLNQLLSAPIALVAISWWLQLFNIHNLVIDDFNAAQLPGEQSQQAFSIHASSDQNYEAQFIPGA